MNTIQVNKTTVLVQFLDLLKQGYNPFKGSATQKCACEILNLNRESVQKLIDNNPKFKVLYEEAKGIGSKIVEEYVFDFDAFDFDNIEGTTVIETTETVDTLVNEITETGETVNQDGYIDHSEKANFTIAI